MDNSLLTAVLLGVLLLWVLSELYGWQQSGLVVPGYLAGVFAIQPQAGVVVAGEAIATYLVAHLLIRFLPRFLPLPRAFGRDRFFFVLLISVGVRLFVEGGGLLTALEHLGLHLDSPLNSLGLVLVPLTANALWKVGVFRGVPYVGLPVLVIYLLLQYVLLPYTNLNFSNFELIYEDLSRDFLSAPRAYIFLLTGAGMAAHMGIRYGWDAGGIIIPGLLAIVWMQPDKLLATVAEVILVVYLVRFLTRLPPLNTANLTGMRPLVLTFGVGYVVKLGFSWIASEHYPGLRVTDLFGFGYLLPSLIAVRCLRYRSFPRVLIPSLATSLVAFLVGTLVGLGLEQTRPLPETTEAAPASRFPGPPRYTVVEALLTPTSLPAPEARSELGDALYMARRNRDYQGEQVAVQAFEKSAVLHSGEHHLFGTAWFRNHARNDLAIVVPEAAEEPGLAEVGVVLAEVLDARRLLLSPGPSLHQSVVRRTSAMLQVVGGPSTSLRVAGRLPTELDLERLATVVPSLVPDWTLDPDNPADARLVLSESALLTAATSRFDGPVLEDRIPLYDPEGDPMPVPPGSPDRGSRNHLVVLDRCLVKPLLRARDGNPDWLRLAAAHAARWGLAVQQDEELVAVGPTEQRAPPRYTLWLSRNPADNLIFEVRSGRRHYMAAEVARTWWAGTGGIGLLVHDAGADLDADALRRAGANTPELAILRRLVLAHEQPTVVAVNAYREDEFPGADAVLSIGRPLTEQDPIPDYLLETSKLVQRAGGTVTWYDGDSQRMRFYDPANPFPEMVDYAGGRYVTVYLSPVFRMRFASLGVSATLRATLKDAGIRIRESSLEEVLDAEPLAERRALELFATVLHALERHYTTSHPGELERLSRRTRDRGYRTWAFVDPDDGLPYLVVDAPDARLVSALGRGRGRLAPSSPSSETAVRLGGHAAAVSREEP